MIFDRLDRYVARVFLSSWAVMLVFFFGFFLVIDLFANADEFVETAQRLSIPARTMTAWVAGLYALKAPSIFLQVAPFVTAIGGIAAVAHLNRHNEIVPVLMSGRSIFRMLRPLFGCAFALVLGTLVVQEWVAPAASDRRIARRVFLCDGRDSIRFGRDRQLQDAQGRTWKGIEIDPVSGVVRRAALRRMAGGRSEVIELADARYDAARGAWTMAGGIRVEDGARVETIGELPSSLTPRRICAEEKEPFDLSFAELGQLFGATGEARWQVLLHYHVTFPLANLLLLLLAIPFVLRYDRQRVMQGFALAFFLCLGYIGVDATMRTLGGEVVHPLLAAWFAPLLFGALGIALFDGVPT